MDSGDIQAFFAGLLIFTVVVGLSFQAFAPGLMRVGFPKLLWIGFWVVGGVLGVLVRRWLTKQR
jgi:hypothetical protein